MVSFELLAGLIKKLEVRPGFDTRVRPLTLYVHFSFYEFKRGSCQLLAKVWTPSTGLGLRKCKPAHE